MLRTRSPKPKFTGREGAAEGGTIGFACASGLLQAKGVRKYISLQCPPHELFPWEYTMKCKPPPNPRHRSWMPEELFSAALCVAAGLSCNGDSLALFTYATSMDVTSP